MNIQNNITTEDLIYDYENTSRYEIILTNNFLEFFPDPEERKFAIDEILDCLLNDHMAAIDEILGNKPEGWMGPGGTGTRDLKTL